MKEKELDNLTRDAIAAQKAGMTYGKYKAMRYDWEQKMQLRRTHPAVKPQKIFNPNPKIPVKVCTFCGKEFPTAGRSANCKYCSYECAARANSERTRERARSLRERKGEEETTEC